LQEQQTVLSVKQSFTAVLLAKEGLKLARDNLWDFRRDLEINEARYDTRAISPSLT
jgi:cobalt-zinc-cadmium efflux system outer membrane protein